MTSPDGPTAAAEGDLLDGALDGSHPAFALLHRPETRGPGVVEVLTGHFSTHTSLADLPLPPDDSSDDPDGGRARGGETHDLLVLVPFRQVAERGFACHDDGTPLTAMRVTGHQDVGTAEVLARIPDTDIDRSPVSAEPDDSAYTEIVRRIVTEAIGSGEGSNFVIRRTFTTEVSGCATEAALTLFRRLLAGESGAYWTFLVHDGERTLVGACPERHVSLRGGEAVMNPVSGTYRYPSSGPTVHGVLDFLADHKEADELSMVVDEELKMMARICPSGARIQGPRLKEMKHLAHSEYYIHGRTDHDPRDILRETMFAPTVTGSPLENACRVIKRYEPGGRGYYSGLVALIGRDRHGQHAMDSSILIRTADVSRDGRLRIGVGSTIVRDSDPAAECAETHAKAAAIISALDQRPSGRLSNDPQVKAALAARNRTLSRYWLSAQDSPDATNDLLAKRRVLVVDAEDTFTSMLASQLEWLGCEVTVRRFDEPYAFDDGDIVVMGPGPGDPSDDQDPKIAHLRDALRTLLAQQRPFLAVCLSHQVLCRHLGLHLVRRDQPHQGVQREIDLFGKPVRAGFYNTFAAQTLAAPASRPDAARLEISTDPVNGEVHALRGPHFASVQFHPESLLTEQGPEILTTLMESLALESR